jgi:hypothetical protein
MYRKSTSGGSNKKRNDNYESDDDIFYDANSNKAK